MKYADLVKFDPIETVIELRDADQNDRAKRLVETYVISDEMARRLNDVIARHLDFQQLDAKGIFVVGNYGTGKSHLMAVVSALAENAELLPLVQNDDVRAAFEPVAGRYLVARFEIGAVKTSLRDIVIREIEKHLRKWDVEYSFPPADRLTNHKDAIEAMLAAVEARHPGKGVLVVVDELLDYLKALGDGAVSAFNFLRELGEASGNGRFRFVAGVQESLLSSPSFGFLASLIQKVSARFVEVWITRQDLAFVVETRLLGKTADQRERIRSHLEQFMPMFPTMSAQKDDFIRLFPVHPRYLQVFESIDIAEKREVLRTLSQEMAALLETDVPQDAPGVIAYDSYWRRILQTPSYLAEPRVGEVEQRSSVVASRVETSLSKPQYKPAAARIVDALSVHRLTVGDIRAPIGLSVTELRDDLALMLPVPERDPDFLATTIESVLKDVLIAVNGQFVSRNEAGQYYLDLDKSIDYEAQVAKKVASLDPVPDRFDRYYFDLLTRLLEQPATTHVPGMKIWQYELSWPGHQVTRSGYLFFGSPNERSTAQPPRSFYLYFLAHFAPTPFEDARRDDEVFLRLSRPTPELIDQIKQYAGATELAQTSSGEEKAQYTAIAEDRRRKATRWLAENVTTAFDFTYAGVMKSVAEAIAGGLKTYGTTTARDVVNALASSALAAAFERQFPGYPTFASLSAPVTDASRVQTATEGLRFLAATIKTDQGRAVLDGLVLTSSNGIDTTKSPYADHIRNLLAAKPEGNVLNRTEVIVAKDGAELMPPFGLEPEWVAVVLAAMAYRGEIEVAVGAQTVDASTLVSAATMGAEAVGRFKTVQRPKATPIAALKALFEMLDLNPSLLDVDADTAVREMQTAVAAEIDLVLRTSTHLGSAQLAGEPVWPAHEAEPMRDRLDAYRAFLDRLTPLNTSGKLKQYKTTIDELDVFRATRSEVRDADRRLERLKEFGTAVAYLRDAKKALDPSDPWQSVADGSINAGRSALDGDDNTIAGARAAIREAKSAYVHRYLELHHAARLDHQGDEAKRRLLASPLMKRLTMLESVSMLPANLAPLKTALPGLLMCRSVDARELEEGTVCPSCRFTPALESVSDAKAELDRVEHELTAVNEDWSKFLAAALDDPAVHEAMGLIDAARAELVRAAVNPDIVPDAAVIKDLNTVLGGLEKVAIGESDLLAALRQGGPATVDDMVARFSAAITAAVASRDKSRTRLVIE